MTRQSLAFDVYISGRLTTGVSSLIPVATKEIKALLQRRDSEETLELLVTFSCKSNVILYDDYLVFFSPYSKGYNEPWVKGIHTQTSLLKPGLMLIGGQAIVGSEQGDLIFPRYTATGIQVPSEKEVYSITTVSAIY